jgi:superfamily II DNA or RNA helicase
MHKLYQAIPWWEHQRKAIETLEKYIKDFNDGKTTKYSLISIPTGTGKTGIIAGISQLMDNIGSVLVIAPRIALRDQLHLNIKETFFTQFKIDVNQLPKKVLNSDDGIPSHNQLNESSQIIVSTIQKLLFLDKNDEVSFQSLVNSISLVIFDEGHYEPARKWNQIIQKFKCPTAIFTATPYRNDLKSFRIAPEHFFFMTMDEAIEKNIVRNVEIQSLPAVSTDLAFVENIINFFEPHRNSNVRVLIRCNNSDEIRRLGQLLVERNYKVVGIHENFRNPNVDWLRHSVPNPSRTDAEIWIHQYKLLEGIDDPRFRIAAIYGQLGNSRSIIQQIGRVIRNPGLESGQTAWVLDWNNKIANVWDMFRKYDSQLRKESEKSKQMLTDENWILNFLSPQPTYFYFDRAFRTLIDLDDSDEITENYSQEILIDKVLENLEEQDCYVKEFQINQDTNVILYINYSNSPYLKNKSYLQDKLNVIVLHKNNNYISYFNSSGKLLYIDESIGVKKIIDQKKLKKLFRKSEESKLTSISMLNSNIGLTSIRSKSISAASVDNLPPLLDDHGQIISTAYGLSVENDANNEKIQVRRYIGFNHGKVSEYKEYVDLEKYLDWADYIIGIMDRKFHSLEIFDRFAKEIPPPKLTEPINILLDINDVQDEFISSGVMGLKAGKPLDISNICVPVENGEFEIEANGIQIRISIIYDAFKKKYFLDSHNLKTLYEHKEKTYPSLVEYLNREQAFRIIPRASNTIYVNGGFFQPFDNYDQPLDANQLDFIYILEPVHELGNIGKEKGDSPYLSDQFWPNDSLFHFIDTFGVNTQAAHLFNTPDIMVCDDMNNEIADFIFADTQNKKVVFIHAKASSEPGFVSAGNLYEVCAQAVKNIGYLSPYQVLTPRESIKKWNSPWRANNSEIRNRIRRGNGNGQEIWDQISTLLRNPNAQREVWLVLGQSLSKQSLINELNRRNTRPYAIQAAYLLRSTLSSIVSIGGNLRVLCSE